MPDTHVITSFLGLQSHRVVRWKRHHKSWIELWLEYDGDTYRCPECGKSFRRYYDRPWVRLRDLDISRHRVYVWVSRYRVRCPQCGVRRVESRIARHHARCTRRFERWLFTLTKSMPVKDVSELARIDWRTVKDAEIRYIVGLLRKRDLNGITDLGIDEVSEKKGHRYLTLVTDTVKRRVIWVGRGRDRAVLKKFFKWFGKKWTRRIRCVVIDMHDPYELEIRKRCPRAALIYDHFHVIKPLSMAIDNIRRRLQSELPPAGRRYLKGSRYLLLRNRENLTAKQHIRLQDLLRLPANETLNAAYIQGRPARHLPTAGPQAGAGRAAGLEAPGAREQDSRAAEVRADARPEALWYPELLQAPQDQRVERRLQQRRQDHQEECLWLS